MLHQIRTTAARAGETLAGDAIGACALIVMLIGALFLPAFL